MDKSILDILFKFGVSRVFFVNKLDTRTKGDVFLPISMKALGYAVG